MITLHILQYLLENGFGTAIDTDLFFEDMPLKNGIAIFSNGGSEDYGKRHSLQKFYLYSRSSSNVLSVYSLEKIKTFFSDDYDNLCSLPIVPGVSNIVYKDASIIAIGNIANIGKDSNDRVIFRLDATIIYRKE